MGKPAPLRETVAVRRISHEADEVFMDAAALFTGGGRPHSPPNLPTLSVRRVIPLRAGYAELGVAQEISPALRAFGIDPVSVICEAGLDLRLFDDASNVIPHAALGRLLRLCVARTNCQQFGVLVGQRATILGLGLVGRLMKHSEALGDALSGMVSNFSRQNRGAVPTLSISDD